MAAIDQSLAGRVAVLDLLPLSYAELRDAHLAPAEIDDWFLGGGYPRIYDRSIAAADYYPNYLRTYVERDVRTTTGISKLTEFQRLLELCAARTSGTLNVQALSRDCGVAVNTVREWMSVLEASFLVHLLRPYHRNLGKRLTKALKLYLLDQSLASNLVGMEESDDIRAYPGRGALFETAVLAEVIKAFYARGRVPKLYYWRDSAQRETRHCERLGTARDSHPNRARTKSGVGHQGHKFHDLLPEVLPSSRLGCGRARRPRYTQDGGVRGRRHVRDLAWPGMRTQRLGQNAVTCTARRTIEGQRRTDEPKRRIINILPPTHLHP
ncbi:MAG: DUF4143 domain-containing protein [Atopobiaceae bacterium]|nr:DUF4143 domain-containing protein [Atopobiaceae bacterium]